MHDDTVDGYTCTPDQDLHHLLSPRRYPWTWWGYVCGDGSTAVDALGRTPDEAAARLVAELRRLHAALDVAADRPELDRFVQDMIGRFGAGALLHVHAVDELGAWLRWLELSTLEPLEALRRWRDVFPAPLGDDPIEADARRRANDQAAGFGGYVLPPGRSVE